MCQCGGCIECLKAQGVKYKHNHNFDLEQLRTCTENDCAECEQVLLDLRDEKLACMVTGELLNTENFECLLDGFPLSKEGERLTNESLFEWNRRVA